MQISPLTGAISNPGIILTHLLETARSTSETGQQVKPASVAGNGKRTAQLAFDVPSAFGNMRSK
jgi:hypothetical protein